MIFVHDKGRMANNILQYGHVYAWGREHGKATMSMRFAYKYPWFRIRHTPHHNFATYVFAKYAAKWGLIPTARFDEENADYSRQEQLMTEKKMIVVGGWYARWYDLFLKYKQEITDLFAFDDVIVQKVAVTMDDYQGPTLGVHIRRGDYATFKGGRYFYNDYQYVKLIKSYADEAGEGAPATVYVCSNDPDIDKTYFRRELVGMKVCFPEGNPAEDLCLLSKCDKLMGPPSTFTLVAAMYHDTPLYWINEPEATPAEADFKTFDELFRHIT